ncbi:hypothetical protein [Nocardia terpenica]|nr:hypothetical protein [Nocardia terpenica]
MGGRHLIPLAQQAFHRDLDGSVTGAVASRKKPSADEPVRWSTVG